MADLTYTPDGGDEINLGKCAPGYKSTIAGKWGVHTLPGQQGSLKEDLGDGDLRTTIRLQFPTTAEYDAIVPILATKRRGVLLHPTRGARQSVIRELREEQTWTESGDARLVDVDFEDAVVGQASGFRAGPAARSQTVVQQSYAADEAMTTLRETIFARPNLAARTLVVTAQTACTASTTAARSYATSAMEAFSLGLYGPTTRQDLLALTPLVQNVLITTCLVSSAADIQTTINALEIMLFSATQLDEAIRAAQPIPVTVFIRQQPGQSVYSFAQSRYGRTALNPAQMRDRVSLIMRLNPNIQRPSLIPEGTAVVCPVQ